MRNVNNRKLKSLKLEGDMKSTPLKQMVMKRYMPSLAQPKQALSFPIPVDGMLAANRPKAVGFQVFSFVSIKIYVMR